MDIKDLIENGFKISNIEHRGVHSTMAIETLMASLRAYFRTAGDLEYVYQKRPFLSMEGYETEDSFYGSSYIIDSSDAIIHFQHFLELFLKDILLDVSQLMVYDPNRNPELLYKMATGVKVSDEELTGIKYVEFSDAIKRVKMMLKKGYLDAKYSFIDEDALDMMECVNTLRNKIAHRGAFVLRYKALDELFGAHLLPFVVNISGLDGYHHILKSNVANSSYNPIRCLIDVYASGDVNEYEVALHKIVAVAAGKNQIHYDLESFGFDFYKEIRQKAVKIAEMEARHEWAEVVRCPVCGCETLVKYTTSDDSEDNDGNIIERVEYVYMVKCHQCGFTLKDWLIDHMDEFSTIVPNYKEIKVYK